MKVYIVTDGHYSDYGIEKVFSNRPAAEEYKKWHRITNEIEEYEIHDEPFTSEDGERAMRIRVQGTVYPEAVVDIKYDITPTIIYSNSAVNGHGIFTNSKAGLFDIYVYRHVSPDMWNEEEYKAKVTKALYDYAAMAKDLLAEGASVDMVKALMNKED